jgi:glucokinase
VASATDTLLRYRELAGDNAVPAEGILELKELVEQGDRAAKEAIAVSANYLAKATLVLINCLNPNIFVFAGGMAMLGDILLNPIREFIRFSTFSTLGENTRIAAASLGMYSGCYGAASLALSEAQALPE